MSRLPSQRSLQAFRLTVLTGSVSTAAATMGRSQPAVSRLLQELESDAGFRLFDRVRGRLLPTTEGLLLFQEVQRAFIGLDRIASAIGEIRNGRRGTLSVAALSAAANALLPGVVARFVRERPGTVLALKALPSPIVVQSVLSGECHLGFVASGSVMAGLRLERHYHVGCMCILPPGHRLAQAAVVEVADLHGEALVGLSASTHLGSQLEAVLDGAGVDKLTRAETPLTHLVSALVLQGVGIGVVDSLTAASHVQAGGAARPFQSRPAAGSNRRIGMEFSIVRLAEGALTTAQAQFIAVVDEALAALPDVSLIP
ncbi:MAG: LysR substrate-binding domain-containing protein [Acetobacteraceae bacterium]